MPDNQDKNNFVVNNPNPSESIPPTEGTVTGGGATNFPKEVQNQNAGLPNAEEKQLKDTIAQETSANKTPGTLPKDPILPEVRKRLAELSQQRMREAGASIPDSVSHDISVEEKEAPKKEEVISGDVKAPRIKSNTGNATIDEMEDRCQEILEEYGGLEGNIPVHSDYWSLRNAIRAEYSKLNM